MDGEETKRKEGEETKGGKGKVSVSEGNILYH